MPRKTLGHVFALFTILIWGATFIASKMLLTEFTPFQIMLMRFIIAYVVLLIMNHKLHKIIWKDEIMFCLLAIFGSTLYFICENIALTYTLASNVGIIIALAPILTALLAHFTTHDERLHKGIFLGFFVAFIGVVLVVFNGTVLLKLNPMGDILSLLAAVMWAVYSTLLKRCVHKYDGIYLTRRVVFYAILTTLPLVIKENKYFPLETLKEPKLFLSLMLLGILGSGICYVTWNYASKWLGIVVTNNYIYLNPFVTMVAAGVLLGEPITIMGLLGSALIIGGIIISDRIKSNKNIENKNYEIGKEL
ncbi:DMT family transporter [Lachnoclostridium phytofermentans]|uniref:EamA domain-containing protein n=1 Tax=Lachnoclostridium phytofermentans (strain ATCC 700394 / DSM 18823 / ISDg) TaxID=357809 RepID=A9KMK4_LACP7|nr:DMT family transporter [Lachnoclostridium phytofermentans]ABX41449.1 protein of unknown function DUF6 transmembrane [Lachnoclostridium phytofermentans ISDg]